MHPSRTTQSLAHSNQLMRALKQEGTQSETTTQRKRLFHPAFKGLLGVLLIGGFLGYRFLYSEAIVLCIYDAYQDATQSWNRQFVVDRNESAYEGNNNQLTTTGKAMIGTGQVLMDVWIIILGVVWIIKVSNLRAFFGVGMFFLTRGLIFLNVEKFPYPAHMAWRSPGFFSFTVPYDHTRDFFYSGHTGSLTVIFLEMATLDIKPLAILAFLSLLFMMNLLLITKVHYVIDIVGGLVMAIWFFRLSTRIVIYFDKLISLPYFGVKWIYENKCMDDPEEDAPPPPPPPPRDLDVNNNEELERPETNQQTNSKLKRNIQQESQQQQ